MSTMTDHTTLTRADGARLEIDYAADGVAQVHITPAPAGPGAHRVGDLACAALREARSHRARSVRTALQLATPSSASVLDALQHRVGTEAAAVELRRAGSSVMVTVPLLP